MKTYSWQGIIKAEFQVWLRDKQLHTNEQITEFVHWYDIRRGRKGIFEAPQIIDWKRKVVTADKISECHERFVSYGIHISNEAAILEVPQV